MFFTISKALQVISLPQQICMLPHNTIIVVTDRGNQSDLITHALRVVLGLKHLLGRGLNLFERVAVGLVLDDGVLTGYLSGYHSVPLMIA